MEVTGGLYHKHTEEAGQRHAHDLEELQVELDTVKGQQVKALEEKKKNSFSSSEEKDCSVKEHKESNDSSKKDQPVHKGDHPKHDVPAAAKNDIGHTKFEAGNAKQHEPSFHKNDGGSYAKHDGYALRHASQQPPSSTHGHIAMNSIVMP